MSERMHPEKFLKESINRKHCPQENSQASRDDDPHAELENNTDTNEFVPASTQPKDCKFFIGRACDRRQLYCEK
jgi:hypothetical protein